MLSLILNVSFMIVYWLQLALPICSGCEYDSNPCAWGAWSRWSSCSQTCGLGIQTRARDSCCMMKHGLDVCLVQCNHTKDFFTYGSLETKLCVSPYYECKFQEYKNTGIKLTDFKEIYYDVINTNNSNDVITRKLMNPPVLIHCSLKYCQHTCMHAYRRNLFCWGYTFKEHDTCLLYFCTGPLSVIHTQVQGTAIDESLYLRVCKNLCSTPHNTATDTPSAGLGTVLNTSLSSHAVSSHLRQSYTVSIVLVIIVGFKL